MLGWYEFNCRVRSFLLQKLASRRTGELLHFGIENGLKQIRLHNQGIQPGARGGGGWGRNGETARMCAYEAGRIEVMRKKRKPPNALARACACLINLLLFTCVCSQVSREIISLNVGVLVRGVARMRQGGPKQGGCYCWCGFYSSVHELCGLLVANVRLCWQKQFN